MLERIALVLRCRVCDLLPEEPLREDTTTREPSLKGAPTYFRIIVANAAKRRSRGRDVAGRPLRADYWD